MFGELPKLFGRNFVVGYFLPAAALAGLVMLDLGAFGLIDFPTQIEEQDLLLNATLSVVAVWFVAVGLLALNRPVIRFLEGYGNRHPLAWRKAAYRKRFVPYAKALRLRRRVDRARLRGRVAPSIGPEDLKRIWRAAEDFPHAGRWILPTRFGNVFRSLEVYSRVVYGLDAIPAWTRLTAVIPDGFREQLAAARAQVDFAVNLVFAGAVCTLLYGAIGVSTWTWPAVWLPFLALLLAWGAYQLALTAVRQFGAHVKGAFDLYRGLLAEQLGLELPRSAEAEREMWSAVNRQMIYRSAYYHRRLLAFRKLQGTDL